MITEKTVLKALNKMDDEKLDIFLANDCRDIGEIIESVCDEDEREYVEFMSQLYSICDGIQEKELQKEKGFINANTINLIEPTLISKEAMEKLSNFNLLSSQFENNKVLRDLAKPMDFSNIVKRRD